MTNNLGFQGFRPSIHATATLRRRAHIEQAAATGWRRRGDHLGEDADAPVPDLPFKLGLFQFVALESFGASGGRDGDSLGQFAHSLAEAVDRR